MEFVNDFKHILVIIAAIIFLLITVFISTRQIKKLPLSYTIQILDSHDESIILTDLRLHFRKYEVAESYARFYRDMFGQQYKFKVMGLKKELLAQ
ncbi:MAG TPA: hypothetical protein VEL11_07665 [Candidatus Bathyarchaeia archaeon]|nr:hypothetical protein [Candidatus Bathyarchaeia archaeon]